MSEFFKCLNCGRVFDDYGDDYWLECPYCRSDKFRNAIEGKDYELLKQNRKAMTK